MKIKLNIKSIIFMTIIAIATLLFINISFAANTGKVVVETAKLREQANTDSKVLELASLGEEVEILNEEEDWYKVKYKNITGYIRKDLIEVENKEAANTTNKNETTEENNKNTTENTNTENSTTENNTTTENTTASETANNNETKTEEVAENEKVKLLEDVKLKIIPLISSIELNEVKKDVEVEITETLNDWIKIKTTDGKEGWITRRITTSTGEIRVLVGLIDNNEETTSTENNSTNTTTEQQIKTMYVNSQTVNLREKADKTSQALKQLTINTKVTVMSTENGWSYVDVNGTKGYIAENLLSSTTKETSRSGLTTREQAAVKSSTTTNSTTTENTTTTNTATSTTASTTTKTITESTSTSQSGNSVVSYAKQFLGCKYVYGGTSPSGFDCSGFTQYVYKNFGVNLNRTAAAQYSNGQSVTSLQAGDLVMFGKSGINHVGIYIGGNSFIHAANKSQGVRIDTLSTGYYKTNYVGARRIF